jgi:hypothetical protein
MITPRKILLNRQDLDRFLLENPGFFAPTERQVVSYGYVYADRRLNAGTRTIAAFMHMRDAAAAHRDLRPRARA